MKSMFTAYWIIGLIFSALVFIRLVRRNDFIDYLHQSMLRRGVNPTNKKMADISLFIAFIVVSIIYPIVIFKMLSNGKG